jgi:hypothetical protein
LSAAGRRFASRFARLAPAEPHVVIADLSVSPQVNALPTLSLLRCRQRALRRRSLF